MQHRVNRCGSCSCLLQVVHRHRRAQDALRFCLPLTQYFGQFWRNSAHITIQALNSLPTWTIGTCGSDRSAFTAALPCSPPRHRCGKALARTPFHLTFKTRSHSHSHSAAWEDTCRSTDVLGEQTTMNKTTQRFQIIYCHTCRRQLRGSQCAGSERCTHHVCGCSKSIRPSHELCA